MWIRPGRAARYRSSSYSHERELQRTAVHDRAIARQVHFQPSDPQRLRLRLDGGRLELAYPITNRDRAVGARLDGAVAVALGEEPPLGHVRVSLVGDAGQSLGAFLGDGAELRLLGTANDGVGKGMSGGRIVVSQPLGTGDAPVLLGNAVLYGATGGEMFVAGGAGERRWGDS